MTETFYPQNPQEWRRWLEQNHLSKTSVNLIFYKKGSGKPTLSWSEAVDEALCFGWIDSTKRTLDHERYTLYFGRRKPYSTWSKINREKVTILIEKELMTSAGLECIEKAKSNGYWTILDEIDELMTPQDLAAEFDKNPGSMEYFHSLKKSDRKLILFWIAMAKRPETRSKRITEVATAAGQGQKPRHLV